MTINIMQQYIELTRKQIYTYLKLVLNRKFDTDIAEKYTDLYINVRYHNFYEDNVNTTMRGKILYKLKELSENLLLDNIDKRDVIENIHLFYYYVLYFDQVVQYRDFNTVIERVNKLRTKRFGNRKDEEFKENLYIKMKEFIQKKEDLLLKFDTKEFLLKISNYPTISSVYRVNLKYDIKFPVIYSETAIQKAFCTGVTNEDKLFVEYNLLTVVIIKDIIKQNFKKQYIVEFADTLLKKKKKLKSLLNIIENTAIQEKINLKIKYENFLKNKDEIYELMRQGYKIAIILDNSFEVNYSNLEKLNMFEYIILNHNLKDYEEIQQSKVVLHNVIEI